MNARTRAKRKAAAVAGEAPPAEAGALARHRRWLTGLLRRLTGDPALAQDLAQETFLKALASGGPREAEKLRPWLAAIAINLARDWARKAARAGQRTAGEEQAEAIADAAPGPLAALLEREMQVCVAEFVDRLPAPQRRVVALHDLIGLNHAETARRLSITEANSRVLLHRGRAALRHLLEDGCVLDFAGGAVPCERKGPEEG